jgi:hypothetical protein
VVRGCKNSDIYGKMTDQYDSNSVNQRKVYELVERLKGRRTNVDDARSGRISTVKCIEVKEQIDQRIREN